MIPSGIPYNEKSEEIIVKIDSREANRKVIASTDTDFGSKLVG